MTLGSLPSITATTLLVVPRSIPMILAIVFSWGLGRPRQVLQGGWGSRTRRALEVGSQHNHADPPVNRKPGPQKCGSRSREPIDRAADKATFPALPGP